MATPHINSEMGDFADVVLMPDDPLRAQHIAKVFFEDAREVCNVRGMLGYTGTGVVSQISQQVMTSPVPGGRYIRGFLTGRPRVFSLFMALT